MENKIKWHGYSDYRGRVANTRVLSRIIYILKTLTPLANYKEFKSFLGQCPNLNDALLWLVGNKILLQLSGREGTKYTLNPHWLKLFEEEQDEMRIVSAK